MKREAAGYYKAAVSERYKSPYRGQALLGDTGLTRGQHTDQREPAS